MGDAEIVDIEQTGNLLQKVDGEDVSRVLMTVTETVTEVIETREMSRARQEELERQLEALEAKGQEDRANIEALSQFLDQHGEMLPEDARREIVTTICDLALYGKKR